MRFSFWAGVGNGLSGDSASTRSRVLVVGEAFGGSYSSLALE